ncbi:hypothetical protein CO046_02245 [Candidatus Peregrinibacteria bacterium CG_4_9_14_0_2_um_filter_53_11]|nr:MAG: hypothetical protein CO046_02245 [Candidatus Peregrinibacteria bacterium CG_4_9_14_0_2_um_filter_53_11]
MSTNSPFTTLRRSFDGLGRNWTTTIPALIVLALVLTLFHTLLLVHQRAEETIHSLEDKLSVTVYIKEGADSFEVSQLISKLKDHTDLISEIEYTSEQDAWELLNQTFSLDTAFLEKYSVSLPPHISIIPTGADALPRIQELVIQEGQGLTVDEGQVGDQQKRLTDELVSFIDGLRASTVKTLLFFMILFGSAGVLLISTIIHLSLQARSKEIMIMKLVGAQRSKITTPYLIEGVLMGIGAFILHLIFVTILPFSTLATKFALNALVFELAAVTILGGVTSYVATTLYLKK